MRPLGLVLTLLATASAAQDADRITLKYGDGGGVSGELVEFSDNVFRIEASVGLIAVPAEDVSCIGAACPEGTALDLPPVPVTLTSLDGKFRVTGNFIDFVDDEYVVATDIGEMRVSALLTTCSGAGCVDTRSSIDREVTLVSGSTRIDGELLRIEDDVYVIENKVLGEMTIDATAFDCLGEACP